MKRFLCIVLGILLSITTLTAGPAQAAQSAANRLCEQQSFQLNPVFPEVIGTRYTFLGRNGSGAARHYWMVEEFSLGSTENRFDSALRITCHPIFDPVVTPMTPVPADGQLPCTSPGDRAEVVDGKIVRHQLIGSRTSVVKRAFPPYSLLYTYRYWHTARQDSPGQWTWTASSVASCWGTQPKGAQ